MIKLEQKFSFEQNFLLFLAYLILKIFDLKVEKKTQKYRIRLAKKFLNFRFLGGFVKVEYVNQQRKKLHI